MVYHGGMKSGSHIPQQATPERVPRKRRSDGAEARDRLVRAALRLFAERGFDKTSTRDIAQAAGVNIAAISYYFGDKAGLYRAVFREPMDMTSDHAACIAEPGLSLRDALGRFIGHFLEPLKQSDLAHLCTRLHYREMVEPAGMWQENIAGFRQMHQALVQLLVRHLGVAKADDDLYRLAFAITGLGVQLVVIHDAIEEIRPALVKSARAVDVWTERLIEYAEAMIAAEAARRTPASSVQKNRL
jgi:AcrR family transcriptional regulator